MMASLYLTALLVLCLVGSGVAFQLGERLEAAAPSAEASQAAAAARASCDTLQGTNCGPFVIGPVVECVFKGQVGTDLVACVKKALGSSNPCYSCACFVAQNFGFSCS